MVCLGDYQEIDFAGIWLPGGIRVGSGEPKKFLTVRLVTDSATAASPEALRRAFHQF
jgi:hypothetical protein